MVVSQKQTTDGKREGRREQKGTLPLAMKEEGIVGGRRFSMCGGIGSVCPERRKLIRNASFGGYNELKNSLTGKEINSLTGKEITNSLTGKEITNRLMGKEITNSFTGKGITNSLTGKEITNSLTGKEITNSLTGKEMMNSLMGKEMMNSLTGKEINSLTGKEINSLTGKEITKKKSLTGKEINSLTGFERKEDIFLLKEDSSLSISKSKSESKLYNGSDKDVSASSNKLTKKESLKVQKKNYREEKKRATKELLSTITDPSVVVMADWLKIRGSLKSWTKLWCVLKPGVLLIYKSQKSDQWVGTVLLSACELIERPSKKNGFCFKLFHPLEQSIWAIKVVLPDDWETTAEVIRETGRKVLGVPSGRRKEDKETWWWNEEVQDSIQRKRLAKKKWDMDRTEENRQEYKELQCRVKREVSKAKQKAYDELYTRLDTREGEKDLYRLARQRDRDGKDVQQVRVIKDRDGRVLTSEESVQRRWKEYFEELMNEENEREKKSRRGELCGTESR
ncbi:hypothetical protein QTP86_012476 [Hemibagrus guttatus]|nr:hypothetical protein QTP86_012476 [Hemibagrus guttatus]